LGEEHASYTGLISNKSAGGAPRPQGETLLESSGISDLFLVLQQFG